VDVIFPTWPILLYANPAFGSYLLESLFRYQATGQYPHKWSVHDLGAPLPSRVQCVSYCSAGTSYPKALGHNNGNDEPMPIEGAWGNLKAWPLLISHAESGNMVIMALSYAQKSGDLSQLRRYVRFFSVAGRVSCFPTVWLA